MSREIKFRVWDKILGKFIGIDAIQWDENNNIETIKRVGIAPGYSWTEPENIELMQFTGLLDKNGKEIYEGDVVHNLPTKESVLAPKGWIGEVVYRNYKRNDGFYDCGFYLNCGEDIYLHIAKDNEVIGNIYEDSDLLSPSSEEKK